MDTDDDVPDLKQFTSGQEISVFREVPWGVAALLPRKWFHCGIYAWEEKGEREVVEGARGANTALNNAWWGKQAGCERIGWVVVVVRVRVLSREKFSVWSHSMTDLTLPLSLFLAPSLSLLAYGSQENEGTKGVSVTDLFSGSWLLFHPHSPAKEKEREQC